MLVYKITYYDVRKSKDKYVEKTFRNAGMAFYEALKTMRMLPNLHSVSITRVDVNTDTFKDLEEEKKAFLQNVIQTLF